MEKKYSHLAKSRFQAWYTTSCPVLRCNTSCVQNSQNEHILYVHAHFVLWSDTKGILSLREASCGKFLTCCGTLVPSRFQDDKSKISATAPSGVVPGKVIHVYSALASSESPKTHFWSILKTELIVGVIENASRPLSLYVTINWWLIQGLTPSFASRLWGHSMFFIKLSTFIPQFKNLSNGNTIFLEIQYLVNFKFTLSLKQ